MGLIFNNENEIRDKVEGTFGTSDSYLVAIKHNDTKTGLAKLLASNLAYVLDSNRTFIINFDAKGIHEKEMSSTIKGDFLLMPWNEIEAIDVDIKNKKAIIELIHIGKKLAYEIPFDGKIFKDNKENLLHLKENKWHRI
ncbi:MAG: histidine kinase [Anaerococcus sp.]|nr:histidine kinase [Peptoniphilaceae bacterium]MDY3055730.1 histidine kinase [Anaerococcus sp.]